MSTIEDSLYTRMSNHSGLSALISTRAWLGQLPQNPTLPAITFFQVSDERISSMGSDHSLVRARFQFDIWASRYAGTGQIRDVRAQLLSALQRYRASSPVVIQDIFIINGGRDDYDPDFKYKRMTVEMEVIYEE